MGATLTSISNQRAGGAVTGEPGGTPRASLSGYHLVFFGTGCASRRWRGCFLPLAWGIPSRRFARSHPEPDFYRAKLWYCDPSTPGCGRNERNCRSTVTAFNGRYLQRKGMTLAEVKRLISAFNAAVRYKLENSQNGELAAQFEAELRSASLVGRAGRWARPTAVSGDCVRPWVYGTTRNECRMGYACNERTRR